MKHFPLIQTLHELTLTPMGVPGNDKDWPGSWKIVEFKEYPRFPQVSLPTPTELSASFQQVLKNRSTTRSFNAVSIMGSQTLSDLLFWSAGLNRNHHTPQKSTRFYPSGGARYPLEVYCSFAGNSEISPGLYHYNVKKHLLEQLGDHTAQKTVSALHNYPWAKDASVIVFVSALFERNMRKYQERVYRFVLLETGAFLQTLYLVAESLGIGVSALGTIVEPRMQEVLDLQNDDEPILIHAAVGYKN